MKQRTAIIGGERFDVAWTETESSVEATVNGRSYRLEKHRLHGNAVWLGWNGASVEAVVTQRETGYEVFIRGKRIFVEFEDSRRKATRHGRTADGVASIRAPMPGKIVRVLRGQSAEVEANQGIVVMEAMKMQNEIRSPKRGRIVQLNVAEGDAVKLGDLIAQVE
jgi:biotin carboxyl carrier protein